MLLYIKADCKWSGGVEDIRVRPSEQQKQLLWQACPISLYQNTGAESGKNAIRPLVSGRWWSRSIMPLGAQEIELGRGPLWCAWHHQKEGGTLKILVVDAQ